MLNNLLKAKRLILASQSPRRKELLAAMDLEFEVIVRSVDESFPSGLSPAEAAEHIALAKAEAFKMDLKSDQVIITGDTVVAYDDQILGKPKDEAEAKSMLNQLSGRSHLVVSSVCLLMGSKKLVKSDTTTVHFKTLRAGEIDYYIKNYKPFDKAGAYGIQEWIGHIGIIKIEGSYNTVIGLPTHLLYGMLESILKQYKR